MAYCTVDEVFTRIGHATSSSVDLVARVTDAIPAGQRRVDSDTGRQAGFEPVELVKTFSTCDYYGNVLDVARFTIVSVTELALDDDDDGTFETVIAASGYELRKSRDRTDWPYDSLALLDRSLPTGGRRQNRVRITGTFGFPAVPSDINQACSLQSARIAQRTTTALFGVQSFGDVGAAAIRSNDPDYLNLIGPYMLPRVA